MARRKQAPYFVYCGGTNMSTRRGHRKLRAARKLAAAIDARAKKRYSTTRCVVLGRGDLGLTAKEQRARFGRRR